MLCIAVQTSRPQPSAPSITSCNSTVALSVTDLAVQASPKMSRLAVAHRPRLASARRLGRGKLHGFVILRAARSPPVALHPASLRRGSHASGMTQLPPATQVVTSYGLDLHQPDTATSRTHSSRRRPGPTTRFSGSSARGTTDRHAAPVGTNLPWVPTFVGMTELK